MLMLQVVALHNISNPKHPAGYFLPFAKATHSVIIAAYLHSKAILLDYLATETWLSQNYSIAVPQGCQTQSNNVKMAVK